jgi:hypothetical protein
VDSIAELVELLREAGARVTLDAERSIAKPCVVCGSTKPRELIRIGRYERRMGGNLLPGDAIMRPMCADCVALTEATT